ncbi:MAG: phage holin family protein [Candidatus Wolfebacteria bacterium]|nr:phage holin family protein [Candidatus Wolfebacteria bacterium]
MRIISKFIFSFFSNVLALLAAKYFISGFSISASLYGLASATLIFTLINMFIRPILKLIFTPIIFITLGLGIIIVNTLTLYILDYFSTDITISGLTPLLYATILISVINLLVHFSAKRLYKE